MTRIAHCVEDVAAVVIPNASMYPSRARMAERFRLGRWGALGILMVLAFLNYMDRNLVYPLQKLIAADLHVSVAKLGALSTGFHVVYACSAPLIGAISDRVVRKRVLLIALVTWSVITALSGTATGFVSLLVWRALTGAGEGAYFPTAVSLIGDLFGSNRRGLALGLHGMCVTLGGSAGYALGGVLGERFGWRMPFILAVIPGLALALVLHRWFEEPPRGAKKADAEPDPSRRPWLEIVTSAPVLLLSIAACLAAFSMIGINSYLPLYLTEVRHVSVANAGLLTGAFYAASLVGQLMGGLIADRVSDYVRAIRSLFVALPYLLAAPAVFAIAHAGAVAVALASYGFAQFLRGFAEPNIYGTVIESTPASERGSAQGFLLMMTFVGASGAGAGLGAFIETRGFTLAFDALAVSSLAAGALSTLLFFVVRRRVAL